MILMKLQCPFCDNCTLSVDTDNQEIVCNADTASQTACRHLVYADGHYAHWELMPDGATRVAWTNSFGFVHDKFGGDDRMLEYMFELVNGNARRTPSIPFHVESEDISEERLLDAGEIEDMLAMTGWKKVPQGRESCQDYDLNFNVVFCEEAVAFVEEVATIVARRGDQ